MTPLEAAIVDAQALVDSFGAGGPTQPKPGAKEWFELRAAVLGLAWMKRLQQLELTDSPEAADLTYKAALVSNKGMELEEADALVAPVLAAPAAVATL